MQLRFITLLQAVSCSILPLFFPSVIVVGLQIFYFSLIRLILVCAWSPGNGLYLAFIHSPTLIYLPLDVDGQYFEHPPHSRSGDEVKAVTADRPVAGQPSVPS